MTPPRDGSPIANVSQHSQVLRAAQLVSVCREGLYAHYSLADPQVFRLWRTFRDLDQSRLAEVSSVVTKYLRDRSDMDAVKATELRERIQSGNVGVLDVRPQTELEVGHIRARNDVIERDLCAVFGRPFDGRGRGAHNKI